MKKELTNELRDRISAFVGADFVRLFGDNFDWVAELRKRLEWDAAQVEGAKTAIFTITNLLDIATESNSIPYTERVPDDYIFTMKSILAYYKNRLKEDERSLKDVRELINDLS